MIKVELRRESEKNIVFEKLDIFRTGYEKTASDRLYVTDNQNNRIEVNAEDLKEIFKRKIKTS